MLQPESFNVADDDSDGADDDTLLTMLYKNGDRSPARNHDRKPPAPYAAATICTPSTVPNQLRQPEHLPTGTPAKSAHKRPLHELMEGARCNVTSISDRQLKVCVRKANFDKVCVTVEAGVHFEACVDALFRQSTVSTYF